MKTHRTELWAALFAFAFFPAAAQAQNVLRLYGGLAPTSYKISFDRNAPVGYSNQTAKSSYTAANIGLTWISPKGIYVDFATSQSLRDRKSTRLNSSHSQISYAVFCLKKKKKKYADTRDH